MSVISLLFKQSPKLAGYEFDATLEDSFEASVELTRYPVESGVQVNDHRIINPFKYYLTGAMSNNPLKPIVTDFVGGVLSNASRDNPFIAAVSGMSAGFLAGSDATRSSAVLQKLMELMVSGLPFFVDAIDIQLNNMVITKLSRTRDPETENGLVFVAELQELISLDRLPSKNQPSQKQLPDADPSKTAAAANVNLGQQAGYSPDAATTFNVNSAADNIQVRPL